MSSRQLRLIAGFLTVFVLLSFAPTLTDLQAGATELVRGIDLNRIALPDGLGELLLVLAGGLALSVGVIAARRKLQSRRRRTPARRPSTSRAVARPSMAAPLARVPESALARRVRLQSNRGLRVPELAREFGLSQDAVRAALGRVAPAPAAPKGSSFRSRQAGSPPPARASTVVKARNRYQIMA